MSDANFRDLLFEKLGDVIAIRVLHERYKKIIISFDNPLC